MANVVRLLIAFLSRFAEMTCLIVIHSSQYIGLERERERDTHTHTHTQRDRERERKRVGQVAV